MTNGRRADLLAVDTGLARSRTEARRLIDEGRLILRGPGGKRLPLKASTLVADHGALTRDGTAGTDFVSRGALKLAHALRVFSVPVAGRLAADLGQSTGGFTECLLQAGVRLVVGVEVGHGQLAASLRTDPRVFTLEKTHVRDAHRERLAEALDTAIDAGRVRSRGFDLVVVDLSFISQRRVMDAIVALLADDGDLVSLVKPQFELGTGAVDRRGLVRDRAALANLRPAFEAALTGHGMQLCGWTESPITGGDGNHELLMHARHARVTATEAA
ncbi:MAG: TlyA family RNA methyltransferase [Burkholderiaceae bacterium]